MAIKSNFYLDKILAEHPTASYTVSNDFATTSNVPLDGFGASGATGKILTEYSGNNFFGYVKSDVTISKVAPIVNGSEYALYFSGSNKTITIPNQGFLNLNGRYGQYTLEFWTKIEKPYIGKRKIVGSLTDDNNGLYVNQTSLVLQIGKKSFSSYIKDFNRPLLIQITYAEDSVSLIVNGELVGSIALESYDIALLSSSNYIVFGVGTYDCISLYMYRTEVDLAKRRFNYGQAVTFKDETVVLYGGKSVVADYSESNYAVNYIYPITSSWTTTKNDNVDLETNPSYIMTNRYDMPNFYGSSEEITPAISGGTLTFNLKPSTGNLSTANSLLNLPDLSIFKTSTAGFYIHGYYTTLPTSEQTLFKIETKDNNENKDYFKISVNGSTITYTLAYKNETTTLLTDSTNNLVSDNNGKWYFIIGIDIEEFSKYCGKNLNSFFSNQKNLSVYVGGEYDGSAYSKTCTAEIYSVKFLTQDNLDKRALLKLSNGTFYYPSAINSSPNGAEATQNNIIGSYDIRVYADVFNLSTTTYRLSVATNGYVKANIPMSFLCKEVSDSTYSFDFLQFNYSYESPILINSTDTTKLDTTNKNTTSVRSYITFEPLNEAAKADGDFTTTVSPNLNRVLSPSGSISTTKYEIVDNFIIYPPTGIEIKEYAAVIHLDFDVLDVTNNRVEIQKMSLSSVVLSPLSTTQNLLGTKFGTKLVPYTYTLSGATRTYDYKGYNPFVISKNDNPHLYLSRDSGIRLVGTGGTYRGISLPIPDDTSIGFMQVSIFYDAPYEQSTYYAKFPTSTEQIFEIQTSTRNIKFNLTRTGNGDTATIAATETGGTNQNITYYLNGEATATPTISTNKWYTLGIEFTTPLAFSNGTGEFALVGFISIDNLSYYNTSSMDANIYSMFTGTNKLYDNDNFARNLKVDYQKYKYHYQDDSIKQRKTYIIS